MKFSTGQIWDMADHLDGASVMMLIKAVENEIDGIDGLTRDHLLLALRHLVEAGHLRVTRAGRVRVCY